MGIFSSKKKELARAGGDSNTASRGFALGFRKVFGTFGKYVSCMFATAEQKTEYVDVYNRLSFNKSLIADPGNGFSATDKEYGDDLRSNNFLTVGSKGKTFCNYDTDTWNCEEIEQYDKKFIATQLNDEVADMMKMSVDGIEMDAEALENYGYDSEADIEYEEMAVPEVKPGFLPEIIREETVEETPAEIPVVEAPVEMPAVEEPEMQIEETPAEIPVVEAPVEIEVVEETAEESVEIEVQPVAIEAPAVAGLLMEAKDEEPLEIEVQPVVEVPETETVVEVPAEPETKVEAQDTESMLSFGFGAASAEQTESDAITFGFGTEEEKAEESSFITNSILVSSETAQKATL